MTDGISSINERLKMTDEFFEENWFKSRPDPIQQAFKKYHPYNTYRLKDTGQIVFLHSINEDQGGVVETCKINILPECNRDMFMIEARQVFGINLIDLQDLGITEPWNQ